ncbi:MAG: ABC transporter ATP-binding protein [Actinobacteria bacterium]|nr:ABC transporter ATP-binding protein [Actinomycetota bacterium]
MTAKAVPIVEARGLRVAYGKVTVLDDVDFRVGSGEVVALLGTNGAGKSTLLKTISGILAVRGGSLTLDGEDMTGLTPAEIVGRGVVQMPGGRATFPGLSVRENLVIGGVTVPKGDREERVDEVLAQFPWLAERQGQLAGTLSGGQQQMLALARALIARPRLLMIDELSLGLAPVIVAELLEIVTGLAARGVAVVIVDQHVNLALEYSDRAYFLERGRVRFEGPAADLAGRTDLLRAVFFAGAVA